MANQAAKKRAAENKKQIEKLRSFSAVVWTLYLAFRVIYCWPSFSIFHIIGSFMALLVNGACYYVVASYCAPTYGSNGEILDAGADLNASMFEYSFDIIYITWFVVISSGLLSDWFWLVYLTIPTYATYQIITSVLIPFFSAGSSEDTVTEAKKKRKPKFRTYRR